MSKKYIYFAFFTLILLFALLVTCRPLTKSAQITIFLLAMPMLRVIGYFLFKLLRK